MRGTLQSCEMTRKKEKPKSEAGDSEAKSIIREAHIAEEVDYEEEEIGKLIRKESDE